MQYVSSRKEFPEKGLTERAACRGSRQAALPVFILVHMLWRQLFYKEGFFFGIPRL
jgi:hypothetical protein